MSITARWICRTAFLLFTAALAFPIEAAEGGFRILYAEPLQTQTGDVENLVRKPDAPRLTFHALGHRFDLRLEPNDRVLRALPMKAKARLEALRLYRGRLADRPDSWVRLTVSGSNIYGAIWDGEDLYALAPLRDVAPFLDVPIDESALAASPDGSTLVAYRLSDTLSASALAFCSVLLPDKALDAPPSARSNGLANYRKLVGELQVRAAVNPPEQLSIAVIVDVEMYDELRPDVEGRVLARVNVVDGIFAEQVGVAILLGELEIFTAEPDPFSSTTSNQLLNQVRTHRSITPAIRAQGLAHLLTGKQLQDDIAGVAFLDSLCEPEFGVGLTSLVFFDVTSSALVMAHEVGHNFGAPHDGEGACAAAPPGFLMEPFFNNSDRFSQCSLDQMRPNVQAASCIVPSRFPDVSVTAEAPPPVLYGEAFAYEAQIGSAGSIAATNVRVTVNLAPMLLFVDTASLEGGTCSIQQQQTVTCQRDVLAIGTTARLRLDLRSFRLGSGPITTTATSDGERDNPNNVATTTLNVARAVDVAVSVTPTSITRFTRESFTLAATVRSLGPRTATGVLFEIDVSNLDIVELSPSAGSCDIEFLDVRCQFGDMPAGDSRTIRITAMGREEDNDTLRASVHAANESSFGDANNDQDIRVQFTSAVDMEAPQGVPQLVVPLGEPFSYSLTMSSVGPATATNAIATLFHGSLLVIETASVEGSPCTVDPRTVVCALGNVPGGQSRTIDVTARAPILGKWQPAFEVTADGDDNPDNARGFFHLDVRHAVDVEQGSIVPIGGTETFPISGSSRVRSLGRLAAPNVRVTAKLPDSLVFESATLAGIPCPVNGTDLTCALTSLAPDAEARIDFVIRGSEPGDFTFTMSSTADGDAVSANETRTGTIRVFPFVDVSLQPVAQIQALTGDPFDMHFMVTNERRTAQDVRFLLFDLFGEVEILSATTPGGSCAISATVDCMLGDLDTGQSMQVDIRARVPSGWLIRALHARVEVARDANLANNERPVDVSVLEQPDVALLEMGRLTFTVGSDFDITFRAQTGIMPPVEQAVLEADIPAAFRVNFAFSNQGNCEITAGHIRCELGDIPSQSVRDALFNLSPLDTGDHTITARVSAANDHVAGNNTQNFEIRVIAPPPPPPANDGGGGGGGGGSLGWLTLMGLLAALAQHARLTPAPPASPSRPPASRASRALH